MNNFITGTCETMCPKRELQMREREGILHSLEVSSNKSGSKRPKADPRKVVKEYSRSAAGHAVPKPEDLRTPSALAKTVSYLLELAYYPPRDTPWWVVYEFVSDRLRAVRQDMVIQGLADIRCLSMLEASAFFHAYAMYRLADHARMDQFDAKINRDLCMDCLQRCLALYDLGIETRTRDLAESLSAILCHNNMHSLSRLAALPERLREGTRSTLQFLVATVEGNFVRSGRLLKALSLPLACAAATLLPQIRRQALQILSVAMSSPGKLSVPGAVLARWLLMPSARAALEEASYFGLDKTDDGVGVVFKKSSFLSTALAQVNNCRIEFIEDELQSSDLQILFCKPFNL